MSNVEKARGASPANYHDRRKGERRQQHWLPFEDFIPPQPRKPATPLNMRGTNAAAAFMAQQIAQKVYPGMGLTAAQLAATVVRRYQLNMGEDGTILGPARDLSKKI
jgi:hypothetical protein